MLIRNADTWQLGRGDIRLSQGRIDAIGELSPVEGEDVLDARGGALLPGLHDHHIHLAGLAVRKSSVWCGPPGVNDREELAERLDRPGDGWIRGIGYHESVLGGLPSAQQLDEFVRDRPLRIQHRSGRMWLLNHAALEQVLAHAPPPAGLERDASGFTGRLFDEDGWLRDALASRPPDFSDVSAELAGHGVTGITDMSPSNNGEMARHFADQMESGRLLQRCLLAGELSLSEAQPRRWLLGPAKLHLHESALPPFDEASAFIHAAHDQRRPVAIHCVSEVELVFALAALEDAGAAKGDRIEHASVASMELVGRMADMDLSVCTQPHFVAERGDRYLVDVEPQHRGDLYRLRSLLRAGIPLAGGSDAPFGSANPWKAMAAAVSRRTQGGRDIGSEEALTAEEALSLYLAAPEDLSQMRRIAPGARADLCLLDRPWQDVRTDLGSATVAATIVSGRLVHDGIDQAPLERNTGAQPLAR